MPNSKMVTEFRLVGPEYDGALDLLAKSFPMRMVNIVLKEAVQVHGPENTLIPTNVDFIPVYFEGNSSFSVRAWHETESAEGQVGVLQPYLGNFDVIVGTEEAYLHSMPQEGTGTLYKLTTAETLGLLSLAHVAADHDSAATLADRDPR
jgi:hypothetical protein